MTVTGSLPLDCTKGKATVTTSCSVTAAFYARAGWTVRVTKGGK